MTKVVTTPEVDLSLRTLGPDAVRQVRAWFDHLANWTDDSFVRDNSHELPALPGVFMLRTSSDIRIFFTIDGDTITVLDVATRQTILMTAQ